MDYPSYMIYNKLYSKYVYKRPLSDLVDLAGNLDGKRVVDLCGGEGRLAKYVARRFRANVTLVDQCKDMMPNEEEMPYGVQCVQSDADSFFMNSTEKSFDVVFCRQAINYWFSESSIKHLSKRMRLGGKLIFNTFMYKPPEKPTVKEYRYSSKAGNFNYVEISWLVDDKVHHVQVCEGMPSHVTVFKYLGMYETTDILKENGFKVKMHPDEKTLIYVCTKD